MLFTGISTGLQVYSKIQEGKTAMRVAKYNDNLAEREATNKELEFSEGVKRERISQRKASATQRARLTTTGNLSSTGTPLLVMEETQMNFQTSISDAARATSMQASSFRQQGKMGLWQAKQAKKAATIGAIATGIQGVSQAVSAFGHNRYSGAL